jgi:hypothetical protein
MYKTPHFPASLYKRRKKLMQTFKVHKWKCMESYIIGLQWLNVLGVIMESYIIGLPG